jgi:hypothetical protein
MVTKDDAFLEKTDAFCRFYLDNYIHEQEMIDSGYA